jgi:hypothetical protein
MNVSYSVIKNFISHLNTNNKTIIDFFPQTSTKINLQYFIKYMNLLQIPE